VATIKQLLDGAIAANDQSTVMDLVSLCIEQHDSKHKPLVDEVFVPAIKLLMSHKNPRWAFGWWSPKQAKPFFSSLSAAHADLVIQSLLPFGRIAHQAERVLSYVAETHAALIWAFFLQRLEDKQEHEDDRYEAFPHRLHDLVKPLSRDVRLAVDAVHARYRPNDPLFRFRAGRLLSTVFPAQSQDFLSVLADMAENGPDDDINFILGVFENYEGPPAIHGILKTLVNRLPEGDSRLVRIDICLQSTGVVAGEFGFVQAHRRKRTEFQPWLEDERPKVKAFAEEYLRTLDGRIASEQRSAEQGVELRKLGFEDEESFDEEVPEFESPPAVEELEEEASHGEIGTGDERE
jgi:hypothetical protein